MLTTSLSDAILVEDRGSRLRLRAWRHAPAPAMEAGGAAETAAQAAEAQEAATQASDLGRPPF